MVELSFGAAFLGGVLSLLSPCSALLLPAFFAYAFTSRTELFGRTLVFLAGLATVFVPLGMGASLVGSLLIEYRGTTVLVAGLLLIGFGLLELTGVGFALVPQRLAQGVRPGRGVAAVYTTGLVYGMAGFCSGPLLGGVLTVAGSSANPLLGAGLLLAYSVGTAAPLFFIAWFWDRFQLGRRPWLRGRPLRLGPLRIHSTSLIAGLLFVLLGVSFIAFQGSSALSGVYADIGLDNAGFAAQLWVAGRLGQIPDAVWAVPVALAFGGLWLWRRSQRRRVHPAPPQTGHLSSPGGSGADSLARRR